MGQPWLRCEANSCDECPRIKELEAENARLNRRLKNHGLEAGR